MVGVGLSGEIRMTSTQHSEEAWAVVVWPHSKWQRFDDGACSQSGARIVVACQRKQDAEKHAWDMCARHAIPHSIQRVRISTLGRGKKGAK